MNQRGAGIVIELTPDELYQAVVVGAHRRITSIFRRNKPQHYVSPDGSEWTTEIEACCAEIAFAKHLNRYWSGGVWGKGETVADVNGVQVRWTCYDNGNLLIYPEDEPGSRVVLVTGRAPTYVLRGWVRAGAVQALGTEHPYWLHPENKRAPSWWVPQRELTPLKPRSP